MKGLPIFICALLMLTLIIAVLPTEAEASIYGDTIRLHILAESDAEEDQALKLEVRDMILAEFGERLAAADGREEAEEAARAMLGEIEARVNGFLAEHGASAEVTLTTEWYDTRDYEDFSLPCGYYTSLRVIIGEGSGKNWWCVMYPPLCKDLASERAPEDDGVIDYSDEEIRLIEGGRGRIKFKILELFSGIFGLSS